MHVCLIFHSEFPKQFSTAIQEMVRHLTEHVDVTVISAGDVPQTSEWEGATVHTLVSDSSTAKSLDPTIFGFKANRLLKTLHRRSPVDVVHLHAFPALGLFLSTTPDIPVLADIRGTAVSNRVFEAISRGGLRLQQYLVDEVCTVSEPVAKHVFGTTDGVHIVPLGVDLDRFSPSEVDPIQRPTDGVTAIYVGHLHPARRLETLVEAIAVARADVPELHCVIVGDGAGRDSLERRAADFDVEENVEFVGSVPHGEVPRWLAMADIGLGYVADKPQYRHQPPIKTVEYLASGLPVVATNTAGNAQFVTESVGQLSPDSADAYGSTLREVATTLDRFDSNSSRAAVQRYDYSTIVETDLMPLYRKMAAK